MTQPNQSELKQQIAKIVHRVKSDKFRPLAASVATRYIMELITANYTPNTKLKALIKASEKLNLEFHGRPDCKNCALQEQLAELIKAKENV